MSIIYVYVTHIHICHSYTYMSLIYVYVDVLVIDTLAFCIDDKCNLTHFSYIQQGLIDEGTPGVTCSLPAKL